MKGLARLVVDGCDEGFLLAADAGGAAVGLDEALVRLDVGIDVVDPLDAVYLVRNDVPSGVVVDEGCEHSFIVLARSDRACEIDPVDNFLELGGVAPMSDDNRKAVVGANCGRIAGVDRGN